MDVDPAQEARDELSAESDAELLAYMAMASDDPAGARNAWETFYLRHVDYLYAVCLRAYGSVLGGPQGAADLVADTFKRAYEHAGKFDAGGIEDAERLRRRMRAWLGRIAQRLAQTALRGRGKLPTQMLQQEHWQQVAPAESPGPADPQRIGRVRQAIAGLSAREQTVIRVTFQWYQAGKDHQRLPNDVAAELAETLQTTPENLRQIRRRALRKIKAFLECPADDDAGGPVR